MKKLLTVFGLLAMVVTLPALASDADREGKREQAKKKCVQWMTSKRKSAGPWKTSVTAR